MPFSLITAAIASFSVFGGVAIVGFSAFQSFLIRSALGLALNALGRALAPGASGSGGFSLRGESGSAMDHQIIYGRTKVGGLRVYDATTGAENKYLHRILAFAGHAIESYDEIYLNDELIEIGEESAPDEPTYFVYTCQRQVVERRSGDDGGSDTVWDNDEYIIRLTNTAGNIFEEGEYFDTPTINKLKGETQAYQEIVGVRVNSVVGSNATAVLTDKYAGYVRISKAYGGENQLAPALLVAETANLTDGRWTEDHRLQGISYIYTRLQFKQSLYPNGIPSISAVVKGRKVFDPRTNTTAWSDNPILCIRDYMTASFGLGIDPSRIDAESFKNAANVCDELVGTEKRYTLNGTFTTGATPASILSEMLTSCGGLLWFSQGKWYIKAASWAGPVAGITLTEDDFLSSVRISTRTSRRDLFNSVKGTFSGEETDWQETDYPEVKDAFSVATDGGFVNTLNFPLPFTKTASMAQRIARVALNRNREQLTISATFGLKALNLSVGDVVQVTNSRFGWVNKTFEVSSWTYAVNEDGSIAVSMILREISAAVFTAVNGAIFERNNTRLPDFTEVANVSVKVATELRVVNEAATGVLIAEVIAGRGNLDKVQVHYKKSTNSVWRSMGEGTPGIYEALGIADGQYDVRARAVNSFGWEGDWFYVVNRYIQPFAAPPGDVTDFSSNVIGENILLSWEPPSDPDLSFYRVRFSEKTSGATYQDAVNIVGKVSRPATTVFVPAQTGTYFIRAFDKTGKGSENPASTVVFEDVGDTIPKNVVATLNEGTTGYLGTKTNVVKVDEGGSSYITLANRSVGVGYYNFNNYFDLGVKQTSQVRSLFDVVFMNYASLFDSETGLFDDATGLFDGDPNLFETVSAKVQVATTNDDPAGTPVWSPWKDFIKGTLAARAVKFRVVLTTTDKNYAPSVRNLRVVIDMPDRVLSEDDVVFTGSKTITFANPFRVKPAVSLSLADLNAGQYYRVTSKTKSGFTVTVYNSGGAVATNPVNMDYIAKGYGKEL